MSIVKLLGIVLIVAGVFGLVYGSFTYPGKKHEAKMGNMEISMNESKSQSVPVWAGVGLIVIGGVFLLVSGKSK